MERLSNQLVSAGDAWFPLVLSSWRESVGRFRRQNSGISHSHM